eukprot:g2483.t1
MQSNKTQVTDTVTTICTITALSSRGFKGRDFHTTALKLILLPSLEKTIEQKYSYRSFFGYDKGDQYWEKHKPHVEKHFDHHDNIEVNYIMITGGSYTKAVNGIAKYAHTSKGAKCDYYVRVNDDAEFQSNGWTSAATTVLKNFQPSNIGAVGPEIILKIFQIVLKTYKRIIYTDIDTVWLSDPRPYFSGNSDLWMQVDAIHSGRNYYCTGFFAMIYSDAIIQLMKDWDSSLREKNQLNQPLFNNLLKNSKVKHQGLDRKKFPSGNLYFDKGQRKGVVIVHNNFIQGYDKKVKRFKSVGLWHPK